ncbi:pfkB family carbohydrate kinase [Salinisphaera sp. T31B1]
MDVLGRHMSQMPPVGSSDRIDEIRLTVAGTAGGTAVDCAKLGMQTVGFGAVGSDDNADVLLDLMRRHGIETAFMQRLADTTTSSTILPILPSGERSAWHAPGASSAFSPSPADLMRAVESDFVHLGGTGRLDAFDGPASRNFLAQAKQADCITTLDLIGARAEVSALVDPLMPYVDYYVPSIEEVSRLTGYEDVEAAAEHYIALGAGHCCITLGAQGSYIRAADGACHRIPAIQQIEILDTTGCGDAYSAGLIVALDQGWDLEFCGYFATAASALVATGLGSDAGIVSRQETKALAEQHYRRFANA